jgi:hypothetical protein
MMGKMDLKKLILDELKEMEQAIAGLQGLKTAAERQTDLEIAILKRQVAKQNDARMKIDESIRILESLK